MERRSLLSYVVAACAFVTVLCPLARAQYGGGSGTAEDPFQIWTAEQMYAFGAEPNDWGKHFKLMADIDLGQYRLSRFDTIGHSNSPFTGVFDGAGHAIANLFAPPGLFGNVRQEPLGDERSAVVRDLRLLSPRVGSTTSPAGALVAEFESVRIINCHVEGGKVEASTCVGGLVGMMEAGAAIERCTSSGTVSAESRTEGRAGGLVGRNRGTSSNCHASGDVWAGVSGGGLVGSNNGILLECYASGDVRSDSEAGGLVGRNYDVISNCHASGSVWASVYGGGLAGSNERILTDCYATGDVSAGWGAGGLTGLSAGFIRSSFATGTVSDANDAGGLVGLNYGFPQRRPDLSASIVNCYATGTVSGSVAGGLVGRNGVDEYIANISCCYATGFVSGATRAGGLVGVQRFGSVESSFWDRQTSGSAVGPWGGGMTTAQMRTAATFLDAGWDFVDETANGPDDT